MRCCPDMRRKGSLFNTLGYKVKMSDILKLYKLSASGKALCCFLRAWNANLFVHKPLSTPQIVLAICLRLPK